jgi:hypothetical protein
MRFQINKALFFWSILANKVPPIIEERINPQNRKWNSYDILKWKRVYIFIVKNVYYNNKS